ncbi:MAG TPA: GxxExxY protein [Methanocorpusculum sp.]|nr:GxxExxY protein [Methanocorpusculum sp.]
MYQKALERMLSREGIPFESKKKVPIFFEGEDIGAVLELDILVDSKIILELKSLNKLTPANERQIISYLKATGKEVGLLINFGETRLKWKRFVNTSPILDNTQ